MVVLNQVTGIEWADRIGPTVHETAWVQPKRIGERQLTQSGADSVLLMNHLEDA